MEFNAGWLWFTAAAFLLVVEMFTAGFFVFWFGLAAAVAGVIALAGGGPLWQWLAFVILSAGLAAYSRRFAERFTGQQPPGIGADRMLGQPGIVLETIDNDRGTGSVRMQSEDWRARSDDGSIIPADAKVSVLRIDGTHLIVTPLKEA